MEQEIKYKQEIDRFFETMFRTSYMNDDDWQEFFQEFSKIIDYPELENQIETGIKNGHSFKEQLDILTNFFDEVATS